MKSQKKFNFRTLLVIVLLLLIVINAAFLWWIGLPQAQEKAVALFAASASLTPQPATQTITPSPTDTLRPTKVNDGTQPQVIMMDRSLTEKGAMVLAMGDGLFTHLFVYHPEYMKFTRLLDSNADERDPALSQDGTKLAFRSRRDGVWDIYILDLTNGDIKRFTNTPEYDGKPTWSPDGQWIAYETYLDNNLEIMVKSVSDPSQQVLRLTNDPGMDMAPSWSPLGRVIAFTSMRSGSQEVWLAKLDDPSERFVNISRAPGGRQSSPKWSSDGKYLAWITLKDGLSQAMIWDAEANDGSNTVRSLGEAHQIAWGPTGNVLAAIIEGPNDQKLTVYQAESGGLLIPLTKLPNRVYGLDWRAGKLAELLQTYLFPRNAMSDVIVLSKPNEPSNPAVGGRYRVVELKDVKAAYPYLRDGIDISFDGLRRAVAVQAGWDVLAELENAYIPLTSPDMPGISENWLYTGRAFALNALPVYAKWMVLAREDTGGETYWRLYIRTRFQNGNQGEPITIPVWNLDARFTGNPQAYEQGGEEVNAPEGYWLDFTELAQRYGWERLPALQNWRAFYPSTRFNQFVMSGFSSWKSAMAEIYPSEALATSTGMPTYTPSPTPTSEIPTVTLTSTPRPTRTVTPKP
jgi:TolB protein